MLLLILAGTMIFHTTLFNLPGASWPPHADPSAPTSRVSARAGQGIVLGVPLSGCAGARERGYDLCLEEQTCYMKDALPESPEPAQPLRSLTKRQGKRGEGEGGSCTLMLSLSTGRGLLSLPLGEGFSNFPSPPGAVGLLGPRLDSGISISSVIFQACLPSSTALDLGLLGGKVPHLSRWDPPKQTPPHLNHDCCHSKRVCSCFATP